MSGLRFPPVPHGHAGAPERRERKAQVVARIARQREARRARRTAMALQAQAAAQDPEAADAASGFAGKDVLQALAGHPVATAGGIAALWLLGPRRLLRTVAWLLPVLVRVGLRR